MGDSRAPSVADGDTGAEQHERRYGLKHHRPGIAIGLRWF
jgi:hypothetical protein